MNTVPTPPVLSTLHSRKIYDQLLAHVFHYKNLDEALTWKEIARLNISPGRSQNRLTDMSLFARLQAVTLERGAFIDTVKRPDGATSSTFPYAPEATYEDYGALEGSIDYRLPGHEDRPLVAVVRRTVKDIASPLGSYAVTYAAALEMVRDDIGPDDIHHLDS